MAIRRLFTDQLVVRKLKTTSGYKKTYQATATCEAHVQRMDLERANLGGYVAGQTYMGWLPVDLGFIPEMGDHVTDKNSREYVVKEANKWAFGINQHWELVLERYNPEDRE